MKNILILVVKFSLLILLSSCATLKEFSNMKDIPGLNKISGLESINTKTSGNLDIRQAIDGAKDLAKAATLSDKEVKEMSLAYAGHSDRKNRVAPSGSKYGKRLANLTKNHRNEDGLKLNYKVYLSKQLNAFALADGTVRVYSGLMDLLDDEELLAVIGHEIGHVKLGHSAKRIKLARASSGIRKGVSSTAGTAGILADSDMLGGLFEKVINSQFSQSQETASDEYSVKFLMQKGYNPQGAIRAFNKLSANEGEAGMISQILSSHPASKKRAEHLAKIINEQGGQVVSTSGTTDKMAKTKSAKELSSVPVSSAATTTTSSVASTSSPVYSTESTYSKEVSAVRETAPVRKASSKRVYYVQVAAETTSSAALDLQAKLTNLGFKTMQQNALVNGVNYKRILVGPYNLRRDANAAKKRVMDASVVNDEPFIRKIR